MICKIKLKIIDQNKIQELLQKYESRLNNIENEILNIINNIYEKLYNILIKEMKDLKNILKIGSIIFIIILLNCASSGFDDYSLSCLIMYGIIIIGIFRILPELMEEYYKYSRALNKLKKINRKSIYSYEELLDIAATLGSSESIKKIYIVENKVNEYSQILSEYERVRGCISGLENGCCVSKECVDVVESISMVGEFECPGRVPRGLCVLSGVDEVLSFIRGFFERGDPVYCAQCSIVAVVGGRLCGRGDAVCSLARLLGENWDYFAAGVREEVDRGWRLAVEGRDVAFTVIEGLVELLRDVERLAVEAGSCEGVDARALLERAREFRVGLEGYRDVVERLMLLGKVSGLLREAEELRRKALGRAEAWLQGGAGGEVEGGVRSPLYEPGPGPG